MQLKANAPPLPSPRLLLPVVLAIFAIATVGAKPARGSDSSDDDQTATARPEKPAKAGKPGDKKVAGEGPRDSNGIEDTASKSAGLEMAAYDDTDHVTVFTPSVHAGIDNVSGASLDASYLVDVVSAASADIVSTASSRWHEVRQAGTISGQYKPHDFGVGVGGSISDEPDYLSYGFYATMIKDFDEKNWTLEGGYGYSHDTAGRCGDNGRCTPFSVFSRELQRGSFNLGLSWVVDRASLASVTMDVVVENGDQSKVYRYIPMFSHQVAPTVPKGASFDFVNANRLPERPLEQLPLERRRFALTGRYAHRFEASTVRFEERVYDDDWGLIASTTDARWIFDLGRRFALWPHARLHVQRSVGFWERAYISGPAGPNGDAWNLPLYRTGDRQLGPLWTTEGGFGIRWYLGAEAEPRKWQLGLTGDVLYTAFTDDLYLTNRLGYMGALTLEVQW